MTTDDELRRMTIGEPRRHDAPITLAEYDPAWPLLYAREAEKVRTALGDRVVLLEHTGSTSVPGLAAKPIIDMTLAVADTTAEGDYVPPLEAAGYVLRIREPCGRRRRTATCTSPASASWRRGRGATRRTTRTRRARWWRRSWGGRAAEPQPRNRRIHPMKSRYHSALRFSDRRCVR